MMSSMFLNCLVICVNKLAKVNNCKAKFRASDCVFKDLNSGTMIGSAKENQRLYYLEDGLGSIHQFTPISSCFESTFVYNIKNNVML